MFYKTLLLSLFVGSALFYQPYDLNASPAKDAKNAGKTIKDGWNDNVADPVSNFFNGLGGK
ncbi:hypothetical protein Bealeia1_01403 [Candidatus Bealeia paramacronuclearis]|uniref:Uncharacterized protein n=1 Tax=Candidatus Bealeia paramacronuclearis TaxID=1921001 RepID=A0ABZ2C656_9PROT|nr:hypothetical protein [Candidatus Bealeia paramacronuclearis]